MPAAPAIAISATLRVRAAIVFVVFVMKKILLLC